MIKFRKPVEQADCDWLGLRMALWPHCGRTEHLKEMSQLAADAQRFMQLIAYDELDKPVGLVEASVRTDYVNGTDSSPVIFLEGLYVEPLARHRGIARAMVIAVEQWASSLGCTEFASDAIADNHSAHSLHRALGFEETERVVFFRKKVPQNL